MKQNMTEGSLAKALISFSIPLILSGILQQLYSWTDAFIVGNVLGESSLAAVGVAANISNFIVMMITGFVSGVSILSARYFGNKNTTIQKKILSTFITILTSCVLLLTILGMLFGEQFLMFLDTPDDILNLATGYLKIVLLGVPFLCIYNTYSAVLRGIGDSKAPFFSVLVSSIINIFLDILLVVILNFGIQGAAIATVIAQASMTIFIVCYAIKKYDFLHFNLRDKLIEITVLKQGLKLSLPIMIQTVITSAGSLILQSFLNGFGTTTVAAITAAYRIDSIILLPLVNLGTAVATVTAQNTGAGYYDRAKKALKYGLAMVSGIAIALTLLVIWLGEPLIALFGVSEEAVKFGAEFFVAIAIFYIFFGLAMAIRGYLEGIGDVVFAGICAILTLTVRIIASYAMVDMFGNMTIAYAEIVAWIFQLLIYITRYLMVKKRKPNQIN